MTAALAGLSLIALRGAPPATAANGECPNAEFRTGHSADLPDCRAYEQVTPADKGGVDLLMADPTMVSSSGERIFFQAPGAFPGAPSAQGHSNYLAERGGGGWSKESLDPRLPLRLLPAVPYYAFDADLSRGLLAHEDPPALVADEPSGNFDLYVRHPDGEHSLVTDRELVNTVSDPAPSGAEVKVVSGDLTHVVFDPVEGYAYHPDDREHVIYYANSRTGEVSYFAFVPDESTADPDDELPAGRVAGAFNEVTAGAGTSIPHWTQGAVSEDGTRVFFTASRSVSGTFPINGAQIYVRVGRGAPGARTVRVSAPEAGVSDPTEEVFAAWFRAASADGSRVLFTSCERLTADSTADSSDGFTRTRSCPFVDLDTTKSDLYLFDVEAGDLVALTGTEMTANDDTSVPADVLGFVGASEDASRAYFVARGNLTEDASGSGPKLYLWEQGAGLRLAATLAPEDITDPFSTNGSTGEIWLSPINADREARVTPDGGHLAFASHASLEPGFDDGGHRQVYVYDAVEDSVACASCVGSGPATADATLRRGGDTPPTPRFVQRNLVDDGSLVFFDTAAALLARQDRNAKRDVYGFDTERGELFLVSSGSSGYGSRFVNASPSGDDVFFKTREQLLSTDTDDLVDIYDARVGGGFPEPDPPPEDCGLDCQGESAPPPAQEAIGSGAFAGAGNLVACGVLVHRRARVHRRADIRQHQARRLARRARRAPDPRARRLVRQARRFHRRSRLLRRHELRLTRRIQRCVSERSE